MDIGFFLSLSLINILLMTFPGRNNPMTVKMMDETRIWIPAFLWAISDISSNETSKPMKKPTTDQQNK
jgi:hypothetical protein